MGARSASVRADQRCVGLLQYVAVRMGLKAKSGVDASVYKETEDEPTEETVAKEAGVGT